MICIVQGDLIVSSFIFIMLIVVCSKLTAQQRALLRAFAETEKDVDGTVRTFDGKILGKFNK